MNILSAGLETFFNDYFWYIIIAGIALVVILVLVVTALIVRASKKRKKAKENASYDHYAAENQFVTAETYLSEGFNEVGEETDEGAATVQDTKADELAAALKQMEESNAPKGDVSADDSGADDSALLDFLGFDSYSTEPVKAEVKDERIDIILGHLKEILDSLKDAADTEKDALRQNEDYQAEIEGLSEAVLGAGARQRESVEGIISKNRALIEQNNKVINGINKMSIDFNRLLFSLSRALERVNALEEASLPPEEDKGFFGSPATEFSIEEEINAAETDKLLEYIKSAQLLKAELLEQGKMYQNELMDSRRSKDLKSLSDRVNSINQNILLLENKIKATKKLVEQNGKQNEPEAIEIKTEKTADNAAADIKPRPTAPRPQKARTAVADESDIEYGLAKKKADILRIRRRLSGDLSIAGVKVLREELREHALEMNEYMLADKALVGLLDRAMTEAQDKLDYLRQRGAMSQGRPRSPSPKPRRKSPPRNN